MAVTPTPPTPPPSRSARDLATTAGDSAGPKKRPRLTKERNAMPATARSSSPEEPLKISSNIKAKIPRKPHLRTKVTDNEFKGALKREATWLETASTTCDNIRNAFTQQEKLLQDLEVIETESCHIVIDLSAKYKISRETRLRLSEELEVVEEKRRKVMSELYQAWTSGSLEGDEMKHNLDKWSMKDHEITGRLERSR
jgi:hypothetical protein